MVSKRVVLADVPPEREPERGYVRMFPRNENRNEGTFACSPGTKTGKRVHSPKPPFYETALLSPGELRKALTSPEPIEIRWFRVISSICTWHLPPQLILPLSVSQSSQTCDPECLLQGPETSSEPNVVRRGCKRCFGPRGQGAKVSQESFAPPKPCFAPVQPSFAPVQQAPAPSPNHFGQFEGSGPCSRHLGSQSQTEFQVTTFSPYCEESGEVFGAKLGANFSEDAMGGWQKEGGGKPHEWHPSQKGVLDPPSYGTFSTPSGVSALFFPEQNPRQSRPEALLEGSKNFGRLSSLVRFPLPIRFAPPPHITTQNLPRKNQQTFCHTKSTTFSLWISQTSKFHRQELLDAFA